MKLCASCQNKYPDDANFCPREECATPEGPHRLILLGADEAPAATAAAGPSLPTGAMASATAVYEGKPDDMYIAASRDHTPGYERDFVSRTLAFYRDELYQRRADGTYPRNPAMSSWWR